MVQHTVDGDDLLQHGRRWRQQARLLRLGSEGAMGRKPQSVVDHPMWGAE